MTARAGALRGGAAVGALVAGTAIAAGAAIAWVLPAVGVDVGYSAARRAAWFGGLALLGAWRRVVTTDIPPDGSFAETLRLAPLAATALALWAGVWLSTRLRTTAPKAGARWLGAAAAALVAGAAGLVLALATVQTSTTANSAGSVEVARGLWPGRTALGAAVLAAGAYAWGQGDPVGRSRRGWRDARAVWVVPGFMLTVVGAVGAAWYLELGAGLVASALLVFPLIGSTALLVLAGAPLRIDLSVITAERATLWLPRDRPLIWVIGVALVALLAVIAGWLRGRREPRPRDRASFVGTVVVGAATALVVALAAALVGRMPAGLGGDVLLQAGPVGAAFVGAAAGALVAAVAGRSGRTDGGQEPGSGERDSANTSVMTTTSPAAGS